jgi:hypothetical protein
MMVRLAAARKFCDNASVPVPRDSHQGFFFGSSSMSLAATIPMLRVGEQGHAGCFSLLVVLVALERVALDATGEGSGWQ